MCVCVCVCMYIYIKLIHFDIYLKLTQNVVNQLYADKILPPKKR